jgi:hypothetical protein
MLVSSYVNGFGGFGQARSLFEVAAIAVQQAQSPGGGFGNAFGLATSFEAFTAASAARRRETFVSSGVFCRVPDARGLFSIECMANAKRGPADDPAKALQQATDLLMNQIPLFEDTRTAQQRGEPIKVKLPDGSTEAVRIPAFPVNPVLSIGGGYDGIIGGGTMQFAAPAMLLAGALSAPPPSVVPAFASPTAFTFVRDASAIAGYFTEVAKNFGRLLAEMKARGNTPAATPLVPETVIVRPGSVEQKKSNLAPIVTAAAAMIGLTAIAAVSAAKKKPDFAYASDTDFVRPALGDRPRGYGRRSRLRARGW